MSDSSFEMKRSLFSTLQYSYPGGSRRAWSSPPFSPLGVVAMSAKAIVRPSAVFLSAALLLVALAVALSPGATLAGDHPKQVVGYVYDIDGRKLANAEVTVRMMDGTTQISVKTDTSDSVGYFSCNFETSEWFDGNKIEVTATYNSLQAENTTLPPVLCNGDFFQWENVTFLYEIPELGKGISGILITGLVLGAVAVAALVLVRKKR